VTARVGVLDHLRPVERLLAFSKGLLQRIKPGLSHRLGCAEIAREARLTSWVASALSSRTNAMLISFLLAAPHMFRDGAIATGK
jgi:hypothetical protein